MYSLLFNLLTSPLGLPIPTIWEWLLLLIINKIAFKISWEASPGGTWGSEIHWAVRALVFIIIWAVTYAFVWTAKWIYTHWIIVLSVGVIALLIAIAVVVVHKRKGNDNHA